VGERERGREGERERGRREKEKREGQMNGRDIDRSVFLMCC
jgi:hypothetical protein